MTERGCNQYFENIDLQYEMHFNQLSQEKKH